MEKQNLKAKKAYFLLCNILIAASATAACFTRPPTPAPHKPLIVVTTTILADVIHNIVGEKAEVYSLMKAGVDPHSYTATFWDIHALQSADFILYSGLHLEGAMAHLLEGLQAEKCGRVYAWSDFLEEKDIIWHGRTHNAQGETLQPGVADPHIWFSVPLVRKTLPGLTQALTRWTPQHRAYYQQQAQTYSQRLTHLHKDLQAGFRRLATPYFITSHDAFEYLGACYGLTVLGIQGVSTAVEPGTRDRLSLQELIVKQRIPAIFPESSVSDTHIQAIVEGCRQDYGYQLTLGEELYSDALGDAASGADTYEKMMRLNLSIILAAQTG